MNLRKRILTGYGITLGLMAAIMLWAILNLVGHERGAAQGRRGGQTR